jgi:SAM-dependent methyltransferase
VDERWATGESPAELGCGCGIMVAPAKGNECAFTGILADTGVICGRSAALYDRLLAGWVHRRFYRAVTTELGSALSGGASVLDVGSGPGRLLLELARAVPTFASWALIHRAT